MSYKTLEELREQEIKKQACFGERMLACGWGTYPMTGQEVIDMYGLYDDAADAPGWLKEWTEDALARGAPGRRQLWAFCMREDGHRYIRMWYVHCWPDEFYVAWTGPEGYAPEWDVPWNVWKLARPDDVGADAKWRMIVAEWLRDDLMTKLKLWPEPIDKRFPAPELW